MLDKAGLATALRTLFEDLSGATAAVKASAFADAVDAYVKTATVSVTTTVGPLDAGLQTSTAPGNPTGPPAVPVPLDGSGSLS